MSDNVDEIIALAKARQSMSPKTRLIIISIVAGLITVGTISWIAVANRGLRQTIRDKEAEIELYETKDKRLVASLDSIREVERNRDIKDSIRQIHTDSLAARLTKLNNSNIVTTNAHYTTITALPVNEFLDLLTGYIDSAEAR